MAHKESVRESEGILKHRSHFHFHLVTPAPLDLSHINSHIIVLESPTSRHPLTPANERFFQLDALWKSVILCSIERASVLQCESRVTYRGAETCFQTETRSTSFYAILISFRITQLFPNGEDAFCKNLKISRSEEFKWNRKNWKRGLFYRMNDFMCLYVNIIYNIIYIYE